MSKAPPPSGRAAGRNPYAGIEDLDQDQDCMAEEKRLFSPRGPATPTNPGVFQNQYLFAENDEDIDAMPDASIADSQAKGVLSKHPLSDEIQPFTTTKKQKYSKKEIQSIVNSLHRHLWTNRQKIWADKVPADPVDMLDPTILTNLLGFNYQEKSIIGVHQTSSGDAVVAGLIDDKAKTIYVSHQLKPKHRRFTAAHEIGHAALHDLRGSMHRDRYEDSQKARRDPKEREADTFATLLLMPENLVWARFKETFHVIPFKISSETAFALGFKSANELAEKCKTKHELAFLLASTERFNFEYFESLADQFRVSTQAMAIRIEELSLV